MTSVMNHGEIDGTPTTTEKPFSRAEMSRGEFFDAKPEPDSRVWDGQQDVRKVSSGYGEVVAKEDEVGSWGKDAVLGARVSGVEGREVRVSKEDWYGKFGDSVASAEHELTTYSCDSPSLESSELSGDTGGWMHGFETGDMVWGKVKSHPWWPGHIYNEGLAFSSVRRMKRHGHVLVAFFGDNSYGWFDPAELIPFEPYFTEKSRQTVARNFVKAVEEAVDEVGRRRALGLSCRCSNPFNFRPSSMPGYYSVDVINTEFSSIYSLKQIVKARDSFVPVGVISFLKHMAVVAQSPFRSTIEWISNTSMLLALRKARFEEFDETYAQAFGVEPIRPSRDASGLLEKPSNLATRAVPLSGPLVFAEALGVKRKSSAKSAAKAAKDKSKAKKEKYLFKRRDDAPTWATVGSPGHRTSESLSVVSTPIHFPQIHHDVSADRREPSEIPKTVDEYVLQRRPSPPDPPLGGSFLAFGNESTSGDVKAEVTPLIPPRSDGSEVDVRPCDFGDRMGVAVSSVDQKPTEVPDPSVHLGVAGKILPLSVVIKKEKKIRKRKKDIAREAAPGDSEPTTMKKRKNIESRLDISGPDLSNFSPNSNPPNVEIMDSGTVGKSVADSVVVKRFPTSENVRTETIRNEVVLGKSSTPLGGVAVTFPQLEFNPQAVDIPLLVDDLLGLALDPFHGSSGDPNLLVRQFLIKFRSLVYQKSLVPSVLPIEYDAPSQIQPRKTEQLFIAKQEGIKPAPEGETREQTQAPPHLTTKQQAKHALKPSGRPEDPTRSGRKRPPSERQEEKTQKKVKKLSKLKLLSSEKKAGIIQKPTEGGTAQEAIQKPPKSQDSNTTILHKKQESLRLSKKQEQVAPPPKVPSPTFLFMKFPVGATLPTLSTMKVKFGRFGPLEPSGARVYWGSSSCKMLFKYRADAQAAYMYARSNDVFGPVRVNYSLRDSEMAEPPPPTKREAEESLQFRPGRSDDATSAIKTQRQQQQQQQQQVGQLKSCLKKSDDIGQQASTKEGPRVKFMLDGDGGRREPPSTVTSGGGNGSSSISSSSLPLPLPPTQMEHNSNFSRPVGFFSQPPPSTMHMVRPPPPPFFPMRPPPQAPMPLFLAAQENATLPHPSHHHQIAPPSKEAYVDISNDMLNLLRRCSDIITNVRTAFGYVPYNSL